MFNDLASEIRFEFIARMRSVQMDHHFGRFMVKFDATAAALNLLKTQALEQAHQFRPRKRDIQIPQFCEQFIERRHATDYSCI